MVDLHCHSHFSDGVLSPEELYNRAVSSGVKIFSLTDHDSVDGVSRLIAANNSQQMQVISGIEFSTRFKKHDIHILGLNIDLANVGLSKVIQLQKDSRVVRAKQISELLAKCGVENAYDKACDIANNNSIGRPHFAKVLLNEGLVRDLQGAFTQYLGARKKAYVATSWIDIPQAVDAIIQAGGSAVIAHPLKYRLTNTKLNELIKEFKDSGGVGIEVVSGDMSAAEIDHAAEISLRFDLLASSGSDYHADRISRVAIGRQKALPKKCNPIWSKWSLN
ncbi:MAG: PHP domain-containing protein [Legionellaceae bacterium]|nr:PHP domain-containing protein [Legionellaceae bacterium]